MRTSWNLGVAMGLVGVSAWAGGGPQNVLVVVNHSSSNSVALGRHYIQARGISERQLFRISTTNERNIDVSVYSNEISGPIFAYLEESGLDEQIDYIVFSRDIPYRVFTGAYSNSQHASLTSTMYYDFFASPNAFVSGCDLALGSSNQYFSTEAAFRRPDAPVNPRYRISAMITASNQADAVLIIDQAVSADFTQPDATVYFEHGEDVLRNGRWVQYEEAVFDSSFLTNGFSAVLVDGFGDPAPRTNAIGLMTGVQAYPRFPITDFVPGAIAEHLTSFAGFLYNDTEGEGYRESQQMKIPTWIANGVVGSYGTVVEPCAFPQKFPQARLHFWYGRGFSLGESFYMALANPYQGLLVGDPLAQPYAVPPIVSIGGIAEDEEVSGEISLSITGSAVAVHGSIDRIDVYMDDLFDETIYRLAPPASNIVTAVIDGNSRSYTVMPGESVSDAAKGLANAINQSPPIIPVRATAMGDRIVLRQKILGETGTGITYSASADLGVATNLGLVAWTAGERLIDAPFYAHAASSLVGTVASGHVFRALATRLDGMVVTNEVVAGAGWTVRTVLQTLMTNINNNPLLTGPDGCLAGRYSQNPYNLLSAEMIFRARSTGWTGMVASVTLTSSNPSAVFSGGGLFNENTNVLTARGMIYLAAGTNTVSISHVLSTTNRPDGPHSLRLVAHQGDGPGAQGHRIRNFRIKNHNLTCAITNLVMNAPLSLYEPVIQFAAADSGASVTGITLWVEGKPVAMTNGLPYHFLIDPGDYGMGEVTLQLLAYNELGQSTISDPVVVEIRDDVVTSTGVPHAWLVQFGLTNHLEVASAEDQDDDGILTSQEYVMNTDPTDSNSVLRVVSINVENPTPTVSWFGASGRLYSVNHTYSLLEDWSILGGATGIVGQNAWVAITNDVMISTTGYYRVHVILP